MLLLVPASMQAPRIEGAALSTELQPDARSPEADESVALPDGASTDWWAAVQNDIGRSEYRVTWQDRTDLPDLPAAYQAPNRAHNLRTYFTPTGIRAVPRTGDSAAWEWGMALAGYGYEGSVRPADSAGLSVNPNPPKDTDGRREGSGRGWVRELQGRWPGVLG